MFCRKALFLAGLTLCVIGSGFSQVVISAQNGYWHDPSTWVGGEIPTWSNSTAVRVEHPVRINASAEVSYLEIASSLVIEAQGILDIVPIDTGGEVRVTGTGELQISGTLIGRDEVHYVSPPDRIFFQQGSTFRYLGASRGFIPIASWHRDATLEIRGFAGSGYVAIAYSDSWKQNFGHVIYDCPLQTSFVDLNGYLKNIQGDFIIRNTNSQSLRLSTTQRPVIAIGGDFRVEGPSEVWMTTTSDSAQLIVAGNFEYRSTSSGPSYFTTRGKCWVEVGGRMSVDASGPLRICSGSPDSTGVRRTTLVLHDGLAVTRGALIAPFPGKGTVVFSGAQEQEVNLTSSTFTGNMDFHFDPGCIVDVGASEIRNGSGDLYVKGHIRVGSAHSMGALQHGMSGNFQIAGEKYFYAGAVIEYNGLARQKIGEAHPNHSDVGLLIRNSSGVDLLKDVTVGEVEVMSGDLNFNTFRLTASGDVQVRSAGLLTGAGTLEVSGNSDAMLSLNGSALQDLVVSKDQFTTVTLTGPASVGRLLHIVNNDVTLETQGYLTLLSAGDDAGATASVGPVSTGSMITGDVTVQRYMQGEGRIYRYIASPVSNAMVSSLMDDFPVTGTFADPSQGKNIIATSPSLYYYDAGWKAYPTQGYASENLLVPGLGYAAFIRGGTTPVVWDVTGSLNQGSVDLPVLYYGNENDPHDGWNLVGNPYAAAIDWSIPHGWERSGISHAFAIRDNGEGRFRYYDGDIGDLEEGLIAPGQAFWVHVASPDPQLIIHEQAKATGDAAFYRSRTDEPDFISIRIEGKESRDVAYIRRRHGASYRLDVFDARKMINERLNLSVLTSDSVSVAIAAAGEIPCLARFDLLMHYPADAGRVQPVPAGNYTLSLMQSGLFAHSDMLIIDHFQRDTVWSDNYSFTVRDDPASSSMHRFSILVRTQSPQNPVVSVPRVACSDTEAVILLDPLVSNPGRYMIVAGETVFEEQQNRISIPAKVLPEDIQYPVYLYAENICEKRLLDTLGLYREPHPSLPEGMPVSRCGTGSATLSVKAVPGILYYWFDDDMNDEAVAEGPTFTTPVLHKTRTYYVVAENTSGCRSVSVPLEVRVIPMDSLEISTGKDLLQSNYHETVWYYDQSPVHTGKTFHPQFTGVYLASVRVEGCTVFASIRYTHPSVIDLSPVPFSNFLQVRSRSGEKISLVRVYDAAGRAVSMIHTDDHAVVLHTHEWMDGMFIIAVTTGTETYRIRVVKRG